RDAEQRQAEQIELDPDAEQQRSEVAVDQDAGNQGRGHREHSGTREPIPRKRAHSPLLEAAYRARSAFTCAAPSNARQRLDLMAGPAVEGLAPRKTGRQGARKPEPIRATNQVIRGIRTEDFVRFRPPRAGPSRADPAPRSRITSRGGTRCRTCADLRAPRRNVPRRCRPARRAAARSTPRRASSATKAAPTTRSASGSRAAD